MQAGIRLLGFKSQLCRLLAARKLEFKALPSQPLPTFAHSPPALLNTMLHSSQTMCSFSFCLKCPSWPFYQVSLTHPSTANIPISHILF